MATQMAISLMIDDKLTLPNDNGVETAYIIDRIEGTQFESTIHLKNANGIPGDTRVITYARTD